MSETTILHIIIGILILSISYLNYRFRPKSINGFVGYRTKRSMASQEAWDFGNSYSGRLMLKYSAGVVSIQLCFLYFFSSEIALQLTAAVWISALICVIIQTEYALRHRR